MVVESIKIDVVNVKDNKNSRLEFEYNDQTDTITLKFNEEPLCDLDRDYLIRYIRRMLELWDFGDE